MIRYNRRQSKNQPGRKPTSPEGDAVAIDPRTIRWLEELAGLELAAAERELLARDLARIVSFVDRLGTGDLAAGAEMRIWGPAEVRRRADEPEPSLPVETFLAATAERAEDCFRIPPVPGEEEPGRD
jgi:Asp-tRNA(Asn)/Glu-tRNA(Gln) amidotransferase C subunit